MKTSRSVVSGYATFVADLKARIAAARLSAVRAVNRELLLLYWDLGHAIVEQQRIHGWGESVVEQVATDLRRAFPEMRGFSASNLWLIRQFCVEYSAPAFLEQAVQELARGQPVPRRARRAAAGPRKNFLEQLVQELLSAVPWGHHVELLKKEKRPAARLYYLRATVRFGWSRRVLLNQLKAGAYERALAGGKIHNFPAALPGQLAGQAEEALKSSYNLGFLGLGRAVRERELEDRLVARLRDFILELGYGFLLHRPPAPARAGGEGVLRRSPLLPPLPQGAGRDRSQDRRVRAGVRRQNGFLPESPQRPRARPGRPAVGRHHPLRREGQPGGRLRAALEGQSHRRGVVQPAAVAAGRAEGQAALGAPARRGPPSRPAVRAEMRRAAGPVQALAASA